MKGFLTFLLLFNIKNQVSGKLSCKISIATINYVTSCPKNQLEWKEAASRKQCDIIARFQNCTTEAEFQYHCLVIKQRNATLEVCAPTRYLLGFCVDYDITLAKVTENYALKCSNFTKPCPTRYKSSYAYKYQDCYQLTYTNNLLPLYNVTERNNDTTENIEIYKETIYFPLFLGVSIALAISIFTNVFVIITKRSWCYNKDYAKISQDDPSDGRRGPSAENPKTDSEEGDTMHMSDLVPTPSGKDGQRDGRAENAKSDSEEESNVHVHMSDPVQAPSGKDSEEQSSMYMSDSVPSPSGKGGSEDYKVVGNIGYSKGEKIIQPEATDELLQEYRAFESYFVETQLYTAVKRQMDKTGMVTIVGQAGEGKTTAARHWIFQHSKNWMIHVVAKPEDLKNVKINSPTIIFIDSMHITLDWKENFNKIYTQARESTMQLKLIITTHYIPENCKSMTMFKDENVVDTALNKLTESHKDQLLKRNMDYVGWKYCIKPKPTKKNYFNEESAIGFPLCAKIYACDTDSSEPGKVFTDPTKYLQDQIKKAIENDKSKSSLTVLLVLYFLKNSTEVDSHHVSNEYYCEKTVPREIISNLKLDFRNLTATAQSLTGLILMQIDTDKFRFSHAKVFESFDSYLFNNYFEKYIKYFPLKTLSHHVQEFSSFTQEQYNEIAKRFIMEMRKGNICDVCKCTILKNNEYLKILCEQMFKQSFDEIEIREKSIPITFWASHFKHTDFVNNILEHLGDGTDEAVHQYVSLLGEYSEKNKKELIKSIGPQCDKKALVQLMEENILHKIILSAKSDNAAHHLIKLLINDGIDVNITDKHKRTPLMVAITFTSNRQLVIELLVSCKETDLKKKDRQKYTALHHCVSAEKSDLECVSIMKLLSRNEADFKLIKNECSSSGDTALSLSTMHVRHSRLMSISFLIHKGCEVEDTIDNLGKTPIYNVVSQTDDHNNNDLVWLDVFSRVVLLLVSIGNCKCLYTTIDGTDENEDRCAWTFINSPKTASCTNNRKGTLLSIISSFPNQELMIKAITPCLHDVESTCNYESTNSDFLNENEYPKELSIGMRNFIRKCARYLCVVQFNTKETRGPGTTSLT